MKTLSFILALLAVSILTIGCADSTSTQSGPTEKTGEADPHAGHDHAEQNHTAKHGGHLIELGRSHEYHAELVDDHTAEMITVYMMDSHMEPLTIEQASISLVLTAGDDTETFELMASQAGGSSKFESSEAKLMEMIDAEEVKGKLRVSIDGKPFSGAFDHHSHDHGEGDDAHAGHDHD